MGKPSHTTSASVRFPYFSNFRLPASCSVAEAVVVVVWTDFQLECQILFCLSDDEDEYGICTSSECETRVGMDTSCRNGYRGFLDGKVSTSRKRRKNARKRERQNENQP